MALALALETSTKSCSVALSQGDIILASREESSDQYIHSEKLHLFIQEVLEKAGVKPSDLAAVAVDKGPGSYTGLRIGVSAAKGLCYALNIPLISADSLRLMALDLISREELGKDDIIIPMLDARRMEVYCAEYNYQGQLLGAIEARIIGKDSFNHLSGKRLHFLGDGSPKAQDILSGLPSVFHSLMYPSSTILAMEAQEKLRKGQLEDVAYFEPFYLKDFIAGKPRKML